MAEHLAIARALALVERHGYALLFLWVLAEQGGIPVPSGPVLLAAGALAHAGRMHLTAALAYAVAASLAADMVWFELGRRRGRQVLRLVCRLSLEPDSCVHRTENAFRRFGMRSLLVSKFVPGLNAVAAPLAGNSRASRVRFGIYDTAGAVLWSGAYLGAGYLFSGELERVLGYVARMGANLAPVAAALFAIWYGRKFLERRRFLRQLEMARITPEELRERMAAGEELFVIDLRHGAAEEATPIVGAVRMAPEEVAEREGEIPRDREIILFCS